MPSIVRSANILDKIGLWLLSYVFMKNLLICMPSIVRNGNIMAKIGLGLLSYVFMKSLLLMSLNTVCVSDCDITNKIYVNCVKKQYIVKSENMFTLVA